MSNPVNAARSLRRAVREAGRKREARRTDYIDFNRIIPEIVAVAIDGKPTYGRKGEIVHEAGRPVAYFAPVHWNEKMERWESFTYPSRRPSYVPTDAITGPLPAARDSLRVRPC